jgi:hypothetical protein
MSELVAAAGTGKVGKDIKVDFKRLG